MLAFCYPRSALCQLLLAQVGPTLALCSPLLGLPRPYVGPMFAYVGPMLPQVGPMLALCWPQVGVRCPYLGLMLAAVGPICAPCWPYVGPMLRHRDDEFGPPMFQTPSTCHVFRSGPPCTPKPRKTRGFATAPRYSSWEPKA